MTGWAGERLPGITWASTTPTVSAWVMWASLLAPRNSSSEGGIGWLSTSTDSADGKITVLLSSEVGSCLLERYYKRRWRLLFCLEGEIRLGFFLEPTVSVLRKAFWLDFQIKCTRTPWLSSFRVQESFFPHEAASRMQTTTISGRNLLTELSEAISIVSYIYIRPARGQRAIRLAPLEPGEHVPTPRGRKHYGQIYTYASSDSPAALQD